MSDGTMLPKDSVTQRESPVAQRENSVTQMVVRELQERVLCGDARPGDRLPSERMWSEQLGVSRQSVREALRGLEVNGLVVRRSRGGTYVGRGDLRHAFLPIFLRLRTGPDFIEDVMELRRILEPAAAGLAASRAEPKQLAAIEEMHRRLLHSEGTQGDGDPGAVLGQAFHVAIAEASNNSAFAALMTALVDVFGLWHEAIVQQRKEKSLTSSRQRIIDALVRRDADAAAAAMLLHLDEVADLISIRTKPPRSTDFAGNGN